MSSVEISNNHVLDWPNAAGFQTTSEQRAPIELKVEGKFPAAVAGTLLRTGPSSYMVDSFKLSHWFDGFTQIYRFQLLPQPDGTCKVLYSSRKQVDQLLERVRKTGKLDGVSFAQKRDPCVGFFGKIKSVFAARNSGDLPGETNIGVTIRQPSSPGSKTLETRTDNSGLKVLDMETLEPVGVSDQSKLHPKLSGPLSCAHAQFDPGNGDCYNYNLDLGRVGTYRIFRTSATTGKTDILATVYDAPASYVHSFFLTENTVVLCIWVAHMSGLGVLWERNILDAISAFDPAAKSLWIVVDRKGDLGVIARFTSDAMFCFHTVNAWEERQADGTMSITTELVEHQNLDILHRMYYDNLVSNSSGAPDYAGRATTQPSLARYRLSNIDRLKSWDANSKAGEAEQIMKIAPANTPELPTTNPRFKTKEHRYTYGICDRGLSSFVDGLVKTDTKTQQATYWSRSKHTPGEAIFVNDPERSDREDGGWLLSCVLDGKTGNSYLLCLDAETMEEVGRAESDAAWGIGFHGSYRASNL